MTSRDKTTTANLGTWAPLAGAHPGIDGDPGPGLGAVLLLRRPQAGREARAIVSAASEVVASLTRTLKQGR